MNSLKIASIAFALSTTLIIGCASNPKFECSVQGNSDEKPSWKCGVSGDIKLANSFIRGISTLIAETAIFTSADFQSLDLTKYKIVLSGDATSVIENNLAVIKVFENGTLLGEKVVPLNKNGNEYSFSNPTEILNWSTNYVDIANNASIEYKTITSGSEGSHTTTELRESGVLRTAASYILPSDINGIGRPKQQN